MTPWFEGGLSNFDLDVCKGFSFKLLSNSNYCSWKCYICLWLWRYLNCIALTSHWLQLLVTLCLKDRDYQLLHLYCHVSGLFLFLQQEEGHTIILHTLAVMRPKIGVMYMTSKCLFPLCNGWYFNRHK
jgi:hypothetical protein